MATYDTLHEFPRVCQACGRPFTFVGYRLCDANRRRYCDECGKSRSRTHIASDPLNVKAYALTKRQKAVSDLYNPFRDHGPPPIPADKVPPHECRVFYRTIRTRLGETVRVEFRR